MVYGQQVEVKTGCIRLVIQCIGRRYTVAIHDLTT